MPPRAEHPEVVRRLRAAGCVYAEDEADLLLDSVSGTIDPGSDPAAELERRVAARVAGTPLEQVLGWAEFAGIRVDVEPGAFVPRTRSTLLVTTALELLPPSGGTVVDLCCGVGAIAAALLARRPALEVYAADLDPAAIRAARRNLTGRTTGPAAADRVVEGDLFDPLPHHLHGRVDVIVCNAPYVPTDAVATMPAEARDHEHRIALDGGSDGLDVQRRVAAGVRTWLAPGGSVVIETSPAQLAGTLALLTAAGLLVTSRHDPEVEGTAAVGTHPGSRDDRRQSSTPGATPSSSSQSSPSS